MNIPRKHLADLAQLRDSATVPVFRRRDVLEPRREEIVNMSEGPPQPGVPDRPLLPAPATIVAKRLPAPMTLRPGRKVAVGSSQNDSRGPGEAAPASSQHQRLPPVKGAVEIVGGGTLSGSSHSAKRTPASAATPDGAAAYTKLGSNTDDAQPSCVTMLAGVPASEACKRSVRDKHEAIFEASRGKVLAARRDNAMHELNVVLQSVFRHFHPVDPSKPATRGHAHAAPSTASTNLLDRWKAMKDSAADMALGRACSPHEQRKHNGGGGVVGDTQAHRSVLVPSVDDLLLLLGSERLHYLTEHRHDTRPTAGGSNSPKNVAKGGGNGSHGGASSADDELNFQHAIALQVQWLVEELGKARERADVGDERYRMILREFAVVEDRCITLQEAFDDMGEQLRVTAATLHSDRHTAAVTIAHVEAQAKEMRELSSRSMKESAEAMRREKDATGRVEELHKVVEKLKKMVSDTKAEATLQQHLARRLNAEKKDLQAQLQGQGAGKGAFTSGRLSLTDGLATAQGTAVPGPSKATGVGKAVQLSRHGADGDLPTARPPPDGNHNPVSRAIMTPSGPAGGPTDRHSGPNESDLIEAVARVKRPIADTAHDGDTTGDASELSAWTRRTGGTRAPRTHDDGRTGGTGDADYFDDIDSEDLDDLLASPVDRFTDADFDALLGGTNTFVGDADNNAAAGDTTDNGAVGVVGQRQRPGSDGSSKSTPPIIKDTTKSTVSRAHSSSIGPAVAAVATASMTDATQAVNPIRTAMVPEGDAAGDSSHSAPTSSALSAEPSTDISSGCHTPTDAEVGPDEGTTMSMAAESVSQTVAGGGDTESGRGPATVATAETTTTATAAPDPRKKSLSKPPTKDTPKEGKKNTTVVAATAGGGKPTAPAPATAATSTSTPTPRKSKPHGDAHPKRTRRSVKSIAHSTDAEAAAAQVPKFPPLSGEQPSHTQERESASGGGGGGGTPSGASLRVTPRQHHTPQHTPRTAATEGQPPRDFAAVVNLMKQKIHQLEGDKQKYASGLVRFRKQATDVSGDLEELREKHRVAVMQIEEFRLESRAAKGSVQSLQQAAEEEVQALQEIMMAERTHNSSERDKLQAALESALADANTYRERSAHFKQQLQAIAAKMISMHNVLLSAPSIQSLLVDSVSCVDLESANETIRRVADFSRKIKELTAEFSSPTVGGAIATADSADALMNSSLTDAQERLSRLQQRMERGNGSGSRPSSSASINPLKKLKRQPSAGTVRSTSPRPGSASTNGGASNPMSPLQRQPIVLCKAAQTDDISVESLARNATPVSAVLSPAATPRLTGRQAAGVRARPQVPLPAALPPPPRVTHRAVGDDCPIQLMRSEREVQCDLVTAQFGTTASSSSAASSPVMRPSESPAATPRRSFRRATGDGPTGAPPQSSTSNGSSVLTPSTTPRKSSQIVKAGGPPKGAVSGAVGGGKGGTAAATGASGPMLRKGTLRRSDLPQQPSSGTSERNGSVSLDSGRSTPGRASGRTPTAVIIGEDDADARDVAELERLQRVQSVRHVSDGPSEAEKGLEAAQEALKKTQTDLDDALAVSRQTEKKMLDFKRKFELTAAKYKKEKQQAEQLHIELGDATTQLSIIQSTFQAQMEQVVDERRELARELDEARRRVATLQETESRSWIVDKNRSFIESTERALRTLQSAVHSAVCSACLETVRVPVAMVPCGHIVCEKCFLLEQHRKRVPVPGDVQLAIRQALVHQAKIDESAAASLLDGPPAIPPLTKPLLAIASGSATGGQLLFCPECDAKCGSQFVRISRIDEITDKVSSVQRAVAEIQVLAKHVVAAEEAMAIDERNQHNSSALTTSVAARTAGGGGEMIRRASSMGSGVMNPTAIAAAATSKGEGPKSHHQNQQQQQRPVLSEEFVRSLPVGDRSHLMRPHFLSVDLEAEDDETDYGPGSP